MDCKKDDAKNGSLIRSVYLIQQGCMCRQNDFLLLQLKQLFHAEMSKMFTFISKSNMYSHVECFLHPLEEE